MDKFPVPTRKRRLFEAVIRIIDLIIYATVFAGGLYALFGTPTTVADELVGAEWLIVMWAGLLMLGGLAGFVGRLIRNWMTELPATWLAATGIIIYFVVLGRFAFTSVTAAVAASLVLVAFMVMARRWAELQIFATDPTNPDWKSRIAQALRRKTPDYSRLA